jgi:hypothetical protein
MRPVDQAGQPNSSSSFRLSVEIQELRIGKVVVDFK